MAPRIDVERAIKALTLDEKVKFLAGATTWTTYAHEQLDIPSITLSDGPHGVRGTAFFNGPPGCLLPSATAMGATFDDALLYSVGEMLASEAKEKGCHVILAPTVCLQRSPLIGRGFEAFGEDPVLSGTIGSAYINGVQKHGIGVSIKHYAAHDQSTMSLEDSIHVTERTMRELHLLPFQIAVKKCNPWSFMTSYHKLNGVHCSENEWLLEKVLRQDWGWDGLVMSDWFGTYSSAEAINNGLDLEMPGPSRWRGELVLWDILSKKVKPSMVDARVRNLLNLINKVDLSLDLAGQETGITQAKRDLCRDVARSSVVLLKNERKILPLDPSKRQTYGLIGPAVKTPSISGGGSADLIPFYISTPFDAIAEVVGTENVRTAIGCHGHIFTPWLSADIHVPNSAELGYFLEFFDVDPGENADAKPLHTTTTTQAQMYFSDNLPAAVPTAYWLRVKTVYVAPTTTTIQLGLCVLGKGLVYFEGKQVIDLFTSHPPKTHPTPMFGQASMEVQAELAVEQGKEYDITIILKNEAAIAGVGALSAGGIRVGCCEKLDRDSALAEAVELAKQVDVPIVIAGLNADYESESIDRSDLDLPPGIDTLIEAVINANPNTVVVTQSGMPILMPWAQQASTLAHAWFGGQETGNAIADVLFGKINPSGRLSVTFPNRLEDTPAFLTFGKADNEIFYGEGVFIGHRYFEKLKNLPLFYFGYGLSYTTFEYSNLVVPKTVKAEQGELAPFEVLVDVENIGSVDGYEIVQVYVSDKESSLQRPIKELKGYTKVWVEAGKKTAARVTLDKYALSFYSEDKESWIAEKGTFEVIISKSADPRDEVLRAPIALEEEFLWVGI